MDTPAALSARPGLNRRAQFRAFLVLGRVSNLPTVWSNCCAGYWLGGWNGPAALLILGVAATLLYVGGMFLNDACDVSFDREFRRERPIAAGTVTRSFVLATAIAFLVSGTVLLGAINLHTFLYGGALTTAIVVYDITHKRTPFAPVLMGGCRFLLYLAAASAGAFGIGTGAVAIGVALWSYVAGLSFVARKESRPRATSNHWPWLMLLVPLPLAVALQSSAATLGRSLPLIVCLAVAAYFLRRGRIGSAVGIFLAGIVFVDLLAIASSSLEVQTGYIFLFFLTLLSQRYVPAT